MRISMAYARPWFIDSKQKEASRMIVLELIREFIRDHPGLFSVLAPLFTVVVGIITYLWGVVSTWRKHRREMLLYRERTDEDSVVIKAAVVRIRDGKKRLSIREWYGRGTISSVYVPYLVQPLRDKVVDVTGLIRFDDRELQFDLVHDSCAHVTANSHDSNVCYLMRRPVHQDRAVVIPLSWQHAGLRMSFGSRVRGMKRLTILILDAASLADMQKADFVDTIQYGTHVTREDAQLIHDMSLRIDEELAKPDGDAAMGTVDLESLMIDKLLAAMEDRIVEKVSARLSESRAA